MSASDLRPSPHLRFQSPFSDDTRYPTLSHAKGHAQPMIEASQSAGRKPISAPSQPKARISACHNSMKVSNVAGEQAAFAQKSPLRGTEQETAYRSA